MDTLKLNSSWGPLLDSRILKSINNLGTVSEVLVLSMCGAITVSSDYFEQTGDWLLVLYLKTVNDLFH